MNFNKKIIVLSGIIIALTVSYVLGNYYSAANISMRKTEEVIFDKNSRENVAGIIIEGLESDMSVGETEVKAEDIILLQKTGSSWTVDINGKKYPAAENQVENMLDSMFSLTKYQIAGKNKSSWSRFKLDDGQARTITMLNENNEPVYTLFHGMDGPSVRSGEYIRTSLNDEVYLSGGSIKRYFIRDHDYWSYLDILPEEITSSDIMSVKITADIDIENQIYKGNLHIAKETADTGYDWKNMAGSKKVDSDKADSLLDNISGITGRGFTEELISSSDAVIEIETSNLGRFFLDIQKKDDQMYIKKRGGEYTYSIESYKIKNIAETIDSIYAAD